MKTRNYILSFLQALTMLVVMTAMMACSSSKDEVEEPPVPIPETPDVVKDPVKVTQYGQSAQFKNDIDAVCQLAFVLRAMTWNYWMMASDGLKQPEDFFTVSPENLGKNQPKLMEEYLEMLTYLVNHADAYEEAFDNLERNDILPKPTGKTRGILSDGLGFNVAAKSSAAMGRQAVMGIIRLGGWSTDAKMLTKLYNEIPAAQRRGYSNAIDFWQDFSAGKIDDRSNVIFNNLYKLSADADTQQFREKCDEIGITPSTNMAIITQKMANAGFNLIVDACPINLSQGIDLYNTVDAQMQVMTNSLKFKKNEDGTFSYDGVNTDVLKNWAQVWGHNVVNYGRDYVKFMDKMEAGWQEEYFTNWDEAKDWWIDNVFKDAYDFTANEQIFSDNLKEAFNDHGKKMGLTTITKVQEINGKEITCIFVVDPETGKIKLGFTKDENGNIQIYPGSDGGKKTITVVNRQTGERYTKQVDINKDKETIIEADLRHDEELLEEKPANGFLRLDPSSWTDNTGDAVSQRITIKTNYMYYQCKTEQDWIEASVARDANFLYVKLKKNDKGKDPNDKDSKPEMRTGAVLVMATDSKGAVLDKAVLSITQKPYVEQKDEGWVRANPSSIEMDGKGGTQHITLDHPFSFNYLGAKVDGSLNSWASLTASDDGYTLKVEPNNTMEDRTGSITFYAAVTASALDDVMNKGVKADPELCATTVVVVKQAAGSTEIKLSPESVEFDAEGGTQKVTIDAGVYKHFEADPDDSSVSWLTVALGSGWSFDVKAKPNNGTEPRSGTVIVRCYNDAKDAGKTVTLKVTQKAIEVQYDVSVDPTELYFSSAMSSQEIAVNCDWDNVPYTHYGVRIPEEYKDWISGKVSGGKVIATVQPNMEFKKREGYINCYVRQKDRPEEEWVFMPVQIYQDKPSPVEASMKFIGKWTYENSRDDWYVEYSFGADGSYFCKWDTPSTKFTETGTYVISSYEEFGSGDVVMEAQLNERYTRDGSVNLRTETVKLVKYSGYIDGKWVEKGLRELQIGWNTYTKKN